MFQRNAVIPASASALLAASALWAAPVSQQIIVDQFGWRATAPVKTAVFADPINGQNSAVTYVPGATFEVRRASDNGIAFTGSIIQWKAGATDADSGDRVWHGNFSSLTAPGTYYIHDPANNLQSHNFELRDNIYNGVLRAATRAFYYNRCGIAITAAHGGNWVHAADHVGPAQDTAAQLRTSSAQGSPRNVSGGWWDAGDYNKYVPFTASPMWNLLTAYELNPANFPDSNNIPESGNGVPDILDEIKWELDWLLKMQLADGSVNNRVGGLSYNVGSNPAADTQARYYTPPTTWATATFAAITAQASRNYAAFDTQFPGYATTLRTASEKAWTYLEANPAMTPASGADGGTGFAAAGAGSNAREDKRRRIHAAAELFRATGMAKYKTYFDANYDDIPGTIQLSHPIQDEWIDPSQCPELTRAYFAYALTPGADTAIVARLKTLFDNAMDWIIEAEYTKQTDPYRAYMFSGHYAWGSNQAKADWAIIAILTIKLGVNPSKHALYRQLAEEYLHYFHGRNPLSQVYLSNMGALGGEKSVMEFYHSWFQDGSALYDGPTSTYGPAPGYLAGGPNQYFSLPSIAPPAGEPPQKSFRDWNTGWNGTMNENSWEITEPSISYQASYVFLVSNFATPLEKGTYFRVW